MAQDKTTNQTRLEQVSNYTIINLQGDFKMKLTQPKSHFLTGILMILTLLLGACTNAAAESVSPPTAAPQEQVKLVISGSGGTIALLKPLAEAFRKEHSNWSFEFLSGAGTSGGVKGALDGTLDLGSMARPPKDEELAQGLKYIHFGTERIAFATSPDISISDLTTAQVKDIFAGKITNWSEVGGPDAPINLLVRDEEESNSQILREALFGETPFPAGAAVLPANIVMVDGFDPADLSHDYPYTKPAGVAYIQANEAKVQPFLDFITSAEAKTFLAKYGITAPTE
jgi:ABC-type phosphate transport system substrate-binding protein